MAAEVKNVRPHWSSRKSATLVAFSGLLCAGTLALYHTRDLAAGRRPGGLIRISRSRVGKDPLALFSKRVEDIFLSVPNPESALAASRAWTAKPHYAGSANDYDSALGLLSAFQTHLGIKPPKTLPVFEAGSSQSRNATLSVLNITEPTAWIDTYYPLLDTPGERKLEILNEDGSVFWSANLEEKYEEGDPAGHWHDALGVWHGLSKGGDVQGRLVYAQYGRKRDFDALAAAGHNLTGTIALVRHGGVFRGLKVKAAEEAGAVGCIIYKDPDWYAAKVEDGHKPWPEGPALNPDSVERGSVQFLSMYPGDPTTPGTPAYRHANRTEALSMPSIPSIPVSFANGKVLLDQLEGQSLFSKRRVRLVNTVHNKFTPIWNTMAVIPGLVRDEIVMIGNHRDAWVLGAGDPASGTVSMHEIARGLGILLSQGWKPYRTIMFASWDAEEYGLMGSTEWGEDFPDFIQQHVVAYMNVDASAAGEKYLLRGSPSLAHLLRQAAEDLPHPNDKNRTLWDARQDIGPYSATGDNGRNTMFHEDSEQHIYASKTGVSMLGSGSDYTVFLQRLGIASMDESFRPTYESAVWHQHSLWDSEKWIETYGDPGFHRHVAVAKHLGLVLLRLTGQPILPLNTTQYALDLDVFLGKLTRLKHAPDLDGLKDAIRKVQEASMTLDLDKYKVETRLRSLLGRATGRLSIDQYIGQYGALTMERECPNGNPKQAIFQEPLSEESPERLKCELIRALEEVRSINKKLSTFEQGFLHEEGIPERTWYRHLGVAPGRWLGYGATTFPALTEAITLDKNSTLAAYEAHRLSKLLEKLAERLN